MEGFGGTVGGVLSVNDVLAASGARKAVRTDEVADTLQTICTRRHPTPHVTAM